MYKIVHKCIFLHACVSAYVIYFCWVEITRHEKLDLSDPTLVLRTPPI